MGSLVVPLSLPPARQNVETIAMLLFGEGGGGIPAHSLPCPNTL